MLRRGIDPADRPVGAAVDDVDPPASCMLKHQTGGSCQIKFDHGLAHGLILQGLGFLVDDDGMEFALGLLEFL